MVVLVTGGAGFIGGHLAESCLDSGYDVVVLDAMDPFYALGLKEHVIDRQQTVAANRGCNYEFIEGDVRDDAVVRPLMADADVVFHHAAKAGVRPSVESPIDYHSVNVDGTLTILEAARDTSLERLVIASSSSVYGGRTELLPFDEADRTQPVSPYGTSKLAAEQYATVYNEVYGIPAVVFRYFTVYGPRMRPNMAISNFVSRCMRGQSPIIFGDGTQTRDFTYIDDVIEINHRALETKAIVGETVNVGSGAAIEIRRLAEEIRDQIDPELDIRFGERYPADADHTLAKIDKAAKLLDYMPHYSISEGVSEFIEWYRYNRDWYEPLIRKS